MKNFISIIIFPVIISAVSAHGYAQGSIPGACSTPGTLDKNPSPLNGSATLGMTYQNSACGLNYVQASRLTETRYTSGPLGSGFPTTLAISGLPACNSILRAYVWYTVSYQSGPPATTIVFTNTVPATTNIPATNIGQDISKCWGELGTVVYRADVTPNISGNGNYILDINGLSNKNWEVDGVTLMIIYQDLSATYQGSLVIWDGAHTGIGSNFTQTMTGINACGASTYANAFLVVSDMQSNVNSGQHPSTLNGVTANYPNNFYNFDVTNTTVTSAQATSNFGTDGLGSDCFCWSLMGLYYQTTSCTTCVPSAISLTVTPTNSTCGNPNGSATATASGSSPPFTYLWSNGATTTSISNLAAGTYTAAVSNAVGCSTMQTFTITTTIGPNVTFTSNPVKCNGQNNGSATLSVSGGTAPYTYSWVTTPVQTTAAATGLAAGTYSVLVSDAAGCSNNYTVAVTQPAVLTATASVVNNVACNGGNNGIATAGQSGGTSPYSYWWTPSGQVVQTVTGLLAGTYSVIVTDSKGCSISSTVTITQPAPITLSQTTIIASCGLSDGSATVTPSGGTAPYTFLWLTSPVQTSQTINNVPAGTYTVTVTDSKGCNNSMSITVPSKGPPVANFNYDPDTVNLLDANIHFLDMSNNAYIWNWDFGDPNNPSGSNQQNPFHIYTDTGYYCITLMITDQGGVCKDTIVKCLRVEAPFTFYIPNAFTPNGDIFNELFMGYGSYIKEFKMWIWDRWGNEVWSCQTNGEPQLSSNCKWDGKVKRNGDVVQEDVYVWKVFIVDANDKKHDYIGHVNVVK